MMHTYEIEGVIIKTENATISYEEERDWNGSNHIGRSSGSQWLYEHLHRSRRGRYYVETRSAIDAVAPWAEWVSPEAAARWLALNEYAVPNELEQFSERVGA